MSAKLHRLTMTTDVILLHKVYHTMYMYVSDSFGAPNPYHVWLAQKQFSMRKLLSESQIVQSVMVKCFSISTGSSI